MASNIKVKVKLSGDVAEVKSLMLHPMETGSRKDPDTGELTDWVQPIVAMFDGCYIEVSPSGTGLHIIVLGTLPTGKGRRRSRNQARRPIPHVRGKRVRLPERVLSVASD